MGTPRLPDRGQLLRIRSDALARSKRIASKSQTSRGTDPGLVNRRRVGVSRLPSHARIFRRQGEGLPSYPTFTRSHCRFSAARLVRTCLAADERRTRLAGPIRTSACRERIALVAASTIPRVVESGRELGCATVRSAEVRSQRAVPAAIRVAGQPRTQPQFQQSCPATGGRGWRQPNLAVLYS
jgi:hypothetical protein